MNIQVLGEKRAANGRTLYRVRLANGHEKLIRSFFCGRGHDKRIVGVAPSNGACMRCKKMHDEARRASRRNGRPVLVPNLKKQRELHDESQRDVARALEITVEEVEALEEQRAMAPPVIIQRMIAYFAHLKRTEREK